MTLEDMETDASSTTDPLDAAILEAVKIIGEEQIDSNDNNILNLFPHKKRI